MTLATAAASTAAATAAAAYLNAKLHIRKDLNSLKRMKKAERSFRDAYAKGRCSLFYPFEDACSQAPNLPAIWSREETYTRRQAFERVCQYGNYFLSLGVEPGQMVAVYHMNSPEFMFMWIGLWSIGCAPAMINYNLTADPLVHCVKIAGAKLLIVDEDESCQTRVYDSATRLEREAGVKIVTLSVDEKKKIAESRFERPPNSLRDTVSHPQQPIALIYTSGTTGLPKAFGFEIGRSYGALTQGTDVLGLVKGQDIWYVCIPMYHGTGGLQAISRMCDGICLAVGKKFSTSMFWEDIRDSGATGFAYVGELARYLLAAPPSPRDKDHNVRLIYGNGLRPDVWERFQERFDIAEVAEFFSSTEGMLYLSIHSRNGFGKATVGHHGAILRAMLHNRYIPVVIDPHTGEMWRDPETGFAKRAPYKEGGEIIVRMQGKQEWPGYYRSEEATSKKIISNVFKEGDLFYRPGDALRRDKEGFWYFLDRLGRYATSRRAEVFTSLGDTFRWKGENVSTAEVSEILGKHPDIQEANVYGVSLPHHDGRAGCAAVELSANAKSRPNWTDITAFARSSLPKYAVPVFVRVVGREAGEMGTHNYKQNKTPYREEGVDPMELGKKVQDGANDEIYWLPPRADSYEPFTSERWHEIAAGRLKI